MENPHRQRSLVGYSPWGKHSVKQIQSLACVTQGPGLGWGGHGGPWYLSGKGDVERSVMIMVAGCGGPRQAGPVGRGRYGVVGPAGLCVLPTRVSTQTPRGRALPPPISLSSSSCGLSFPDSRAWVMDPFRSAPQTCLVQLTSLFRHCAHTHQQSPRPSLAALFGFYYYGFTCSGQFMHVKL